MKEAGIDTGQVIAAIGELWKLGLVALIFFIVFYWRKDWPALLRTFMSVRWKLGPAEAEFRREETVFREKNVEESLSSQGQAALPASSIESGETPTADLPEKDGVQGALPDRFDLFVTLRYERNESKAAEIFARMQKAEDDPVERLKVQAYYWRLRFTNLADTNALEELDKLCRNTDVKHEAHLQKGLIYESTNEFDKSIENFECAVKAARTEKDKATAVVGAARSLFQIDHKQGVLRIIREIGTTTESAALKSYFEGLGKFFETTHNYSLRAIAFEKLLELVPNDTDALFAAAYSYSIGDFNPLTMLHYKNLLEYAPKSDSAFNNLGVAYTHLGMPFRSVESYRKSAQLENTLAMANLASLYMKSGFEEDAAKFLNEAKTKENVHANVGHTMARLVQTKEEEEKKETHLLDKARTAQRFLRNFGDAYFRVDIDCPSFAGKWVSGDRVELEIMLKDNNLLGTWTKKSTFLQSAAEHTFEGNFNNRGATISTKAGKTLMSPSVEKGYAYLSLNGQQLFTLTNNDDQHTFLEFLRIS